MRRVRGSRRGVATVVAGAMVFALGACGGPAGEAKPSVFQEERDRRQDERIEALEAEVAAWKAQARADPAALRRPAAPLAWGAREVAEAERETGSEAVADGAPGTAEPSPEPERPIEVREARAVPAEATVRWTRFTWQVEVSNPADRQRSARLRLQFLDAAGQVLAAGLETVLLEPRETRQVSGFQMLAPAAAMRVARFEVRLD